MFLYEIQKQFITLFHLLQRKYLRSVLIKLVK